VRALTTDEALANITLDLVVAAFRDKLAEVEVSASMTAPTVRPTARVRTFTSRRSRDGHRLQGVVFATLWSEPERPALRFDRARFLEDDGRVRETLCDLPRGTVTRLQFGNVLWPYTDVTTVQWHLTAEPTR
jgi:hypothetical protein